MTEYCLSCLGCQQMKKKGGRSDYEKVSGNGGFHTYSLPASKSLVRR